MTPKTNEVDAVLARIEHATKSPRELARERIAAFRLDRDKGDKPLPVVNLTDAGAPLLSVDATVRASYPNHALNCSSRRPWWARLIWWR